MTTKQENIEILEKIYTRTLKASDTYRNAAKNVHNKSLTVFFEKAAEAHENFADDLKQESKDLGKDMKDKDSSGTNPDQFWLDFASVIVLRNEPAILKNCLKAENKAISLYDEALAHADIREPFKEKLKAQRDYAVSLAEEIDSMEKKYASD